MNDLPLSRRLWNDAEYDGLLEPGQDSYHLAVLEQWKMCVETSERVSTRRALANTLFVTLNGSALSLIGVFWKRRPAGMGPIKLLVPLVVLLVSCLVWWALVRSYRQLNTAKFVIIHELESRLPARVFSREWFLITQSDLDGHYLELTFLERMLPMLFASMYVSAFAVIVWPIH